MRRRNRNKKRLDAYLFPLPFAGLVIVGVSVTLGYILLGLRCQSMGSELKALEQRRDELRREYGQQISKWTEMKSPEQLAASLQRSRIHMTWPSSRQVVRFSRAEIRNRLLPQVGREQLAQVKRSRGDDS